MSTKKDKKENIRNQIIAASHIYRDRLAGKVFLYIFRENYFEVVFQTNCFMHLTGVNSVLNAHNFYEKAKASELTTRQIYFDQKHPYHGAKKKLPCLLLLPSLTDNLVCVVKQLQTMTLTYKIGITNLDFTIGLTENIDSDGNKINDWFLPRTLRVKDKAIESSKEAEFIDFILSKDASIEKYDTISFASKGQKIPMSVMDMISPQIASRLE